MSPDQARLKREVMIELPLTHGAAAVDNSERIGGGRIGRGFAEDWVKPRQ